MNDRLPWMRDGDGFVAYPEGPNLLRRIATLKPAASNPSSRWIWLVEYDLARDSGTAEGKQLAADAATAAWPKNRAKAAELAAAQKRDRDLTELVGRQFMTGNVPLADFEIERSPAKRLEAIIWKARQLFSGSTIPMNLQPLLAACSAELYRRRIDQIADEALESPVAGEEEKHG